ncbi:hypothetical protein VULLAG_LOCUS15038 [Vulpes lagopus]
MLRSGFSWRPAAREGRNLRPGRSLSPSSGRDSGRRRGAAGGGSGPPRKPDPSGAWGTDEAEERRPEGSRATSVFSDSLPLSSPRSPSPKQLSLPGSGRPAPKRTGAPRVPGARARGGLGGSGCPPPHRSPGVGESVRFSEASMHPIRSPNAKNEVAKPF